MYVLKILCQYTRLASGVIGRSDKEGPVMKLASLDFGPKVTRQSLCMIVTSHNDLHVRSPKSAIANRNNLRGMRADRILGGMKIPLAERSGRSEISEHLLIEAL